MLVYQRVPNLYTVLAQVKHVIVKPFHKFLLIIDDINPSHFFGTIFSQGCIPFQAISTFSIFFQISKICFFSWKK